MTPDFPVSNGNGKSHGGDEPKDKLSKVEGALQRITEKDQRPPLPFESRCAVCTSPYRHFIDSMLVKGGYSYVYIANTVPGKGDVKLDRRSISNHAKKHLGFQEQALRALLEEEADLAEQNYEEGVRGAITHRGVLEVAVRKAYDDIIEGRTMVEAKDLVSLVQQIQKMDDQARGVAVDELRAQVSAFIEAIKSETDRETWERISRRAQQLIQRDRLPPGNG